MNKINKILAIILLITSLVFIFYISFNNELFYKTLFNITKERIKEIKSVKEGIQEKEKHYTDNFYNKFMFIETYGIYAKASGKKHINNVYKCDNDIFIFDYNIIDKKNIDYIKNICADNSIKILELSKELKKRNTDFACAVFPSVVDCDKIRLPISLENYYTEAVDVFTKNLIENGIYLLDYRSWVKNAEPESVFFKNDTHWRIKFAFDVFKDIADKLENEYGIQGIKEATNINNYNVETLKNISNGAMSARTGVIYGGLEDIDIIRPNFHTEVRYTGNDGDIKGSFEDALLRSQIIENKDSVSVYGAYWYRVYLNNVEAGSPVKIHNFNSEAKHKILIIGDSYSYPLACFMGISYKDIVLVNLDYVSDDFSLLKLVEEEKPDIVLMEKWDQSLKSFFDLKLN